MALIAKKIKGTEDILPRDSYKWQFIEKILSDEARVYGFSEIRTPVFEQTALFQRGVGEGTDVVQKEMYTFETKGGESLTLRPEGTAGAARALLEHGLYNDGLPIKAHYFTTCYRYEKPQAGRQREFHQFGMEVYGASDPIADAELICVASSIFERLQLEGIRLEINSIGCPECRKNYHNALKAYFAQFTDTLCSTCMSRLEKNPMRILDCKSPVCKEIAANAPKITDFLCEACDDHFKKVQAYLNAADIKFTVNPSIVRGLDYYTNTVFEFISDSIGAQSTVCGGGRYNGLIEELGGNPLPSLGFAIGLERLLMVMEAQGIEIPAPEKDMLYIAALGDKAQLKAFELVRVVRETGLQAQFDIVGRGLKAQMKYANKIGAKFSMVLGDNEIENAKAILKNMESGEQTEVSIDDAHVFIENLLSADLASEIN
ncbi:MAG: histidine--tRNA ligase [Ruminococcaceae bacterium]|nr:histidine--tRNA ligase [Oscillospiraceae bacterium]